MGKNFDPCFCKGKVPGWWNDKITLFYREERAADDRTTVQWNKIQLKNCFFACEYAALDNGTVRREQAKVTLRIPSEQRVLSECGTCRQNGRLFSLSPGDLVVRGFVRDKIKDGVTGVQLKEKYRTRAFTITHVQRNDRLSATAHYHVRAE